MRIYVVRHGHKAGVEPDYDGGPNTPLSDTGKRQAEHLAEFLGEQDIDRIYSSPQLRALQTAEPAHERIGCDWHVWPLFKESSGSTWREKHESDPETAEDAAVWKTGEEITTPSREEIEAKHGHYYLLSDIPDRFPVEMSQPFPWPDAWWKTWVGQFDIQGAARVDLGMEAVLDRHDEDENLAIVCHGNSGEEVIASILRAPRQRVWSTSHANTGVTCLEGSGDDWSIRYMNRNNHLPPELRV